MNAFDHHVGFEEEKMILPLTAQHRAVVSHSHQHPGRIDFPMAGQRVKQTILAQCDQGILFATGSMKTHMPL